MIGLAIAWRAARAGLRVTLADPAPGQGATRAAAGMLTPVAEAAYAERELFELGTRSLAMYPDFAAELTEVTGLPAGLLATGTLLVAYDADDMAVLAEHARLREKFGAPSRELTGRECRQAEPLLAPGIRGGLLIDDDASIDPRLLSPALLAAAAGTGATVIPLAASRLLTEAGRAAGAELADGTIVGAGQVVLAAGWQSASLPGLPPEAAPPLRPVKGQSLRLRPSAATFAAGLPPSLITRTVRAIVAGVPVYLVPRSDGQLIIGATQEEIGPDTAVTAGGVWQLLRDARAVVPGIAELEFAEALAGLRPGSPDNAPILGPGALPGLILATGHFRGGVLMAPVTADLITKILIGEKVPSALVPFLPSRFRGRL